MSDFLSICLKRLQYAGFYAPKNLSEQGKLTSGIAIVAISILSLQIPIVFMFWPHAQATKLTLLVLSIFLMSSTLYFNQRHQSVIARNLLSVTYILYILGSAWIWTIDLHVQYYLLLGILICPFIFAKHESRQLWIWMMCYALSFLTLEWVFQHTAQYSQIHSYPTLHILKLANSTGFVAALGLCCLYTSVLLSRHRNVLQTEKERVSALLHCALPRHIIGKLDINSHSIVAEYHPQVTVLFADIQGFSSICRRVNVMQLVSVLNTLYVSFDHITQKNRLEKIKTNGDQYIAAAGLVSCPKQAAVSACQCALEMQAAFEVLSKKLFDSTGTTAGLRIGIATGDAIAGVLGSDKFSFDLWGDTVNLASRLESQGHDKKIQVNSQTRILTADRFNFTYRGKINFRGIGTLDAYWLQD